MEFNKSKIKLGEIISRSFKLVLDNALEILKIIGIFVVPTVILLFIVMAIFLFAILNTFGTNMYGYSEPSIEQMGSIIFSMIIPFIVLILVMIVISILLYFGYTVIIKLLADKYSEGYGNWKESMKYVWDKKWRLIGVNILVYIIIMTLYMALFLLSALFISEIGIFIFIIIIPLILIAAIILPSIAMLFNSTLIIRDLKVMDTIKQTIMLFKKGSFWTMIGRCAALGGITISLGILLSLVSIIPFVGFIAVLIGQIYIQGFLIAACNIMVIEDRDIDNDFSKGNFID